MPRLTKAEYEEFLSRASRRKQEHQEASDFPSEPAKSGTEDALHDKIIDEVRRRGWLCFHGSMARRTHRTEGEPDFIILADANRFYLVECKTKTGKLSPAQQGVAAHAKKLGHTVFLVRSLDDFIDLVR